MKNILIEVETLQRWQRKLEDSGEITVAEEIYDILQRVERKDEENRKRKAEAEAKSVTMREIKTGDEYRISSKANFKDRYRALLGATVKIIDKKRTNVVIQVVSDIPGFKAATFKVHHDVLEKI